MAGAGAPFASTLVVTTLQQPAEGTFDSIYNCVVLRFCPFCVTECPYLSACLCACVCSGGAGDNGSGGHGGGLIGGDGTLAVGGVGGTQTGSVGTSGRHALGGGDSRDGLAGQMYLGGDAAGGSSAHQGAGGSGWVRCVDDSVWQFLF